MTVFRKGDQGYGVLELTQKLVHVGLLEAPSSRYTEEVECAVEAWQIHNYDSFGEKLASDGIWGPKTAESFEYTPPHPYEPIPGDLLELTRDPRAHDYAKEVVRIALHEFEDGAGEIGGNNQGPYVDKYFLGDELASHRQWAWCAAFTSWCHLEAAQSLGVPCPIEHTGVAQNLHKQLERKSVAFDLGQRELLCGDIITWWRGNVRSWKGHSGMVLGVINDVLYTIEGNIGPYPSHVDVFSYDLTTKKGLEKLLGFGRPSEML